MKAIEVTKYIYAVPALLTAVVIPEVEATIVYTSTAASIIGVASGVFTKNVWITAGSLCLAAINIVLWKNYDAAAKNRGYRAGFEHGAKQEEKEGQSLKVILQKTSQLEQEREYFSAEVQKLTVKNSKLTAELQLAKKEVQTLQGVEKKLGSQVKELDQHVIAQKKEIQRRETIESEQHSQIAHLNSTVISISTAAEGLKEYVVSKETEITSLQGRVRELTAQLAANARK